MEFNNKSKAKVAVLLILVLLSAFQLLFPTELKLYYQLPAAPQDEYWPNHVFMINNNVAQYSVYIITAEETSEYLIEVFVALNYQNVKNDESALEAYKCRLKLIDGENEELIELKPVESTVYYLPDNKKLTFKFQSGNFSLSFKLSNLVAAVVRIADYVTYDGVSKNSNGTFTLPYSMIQYQRPTLLKQNNPINKSVGVCAHYIYKTSDHILAWIDMHLSFGVAEILFYDSTENSTLTAMLSRKYDNDARIKVVKYKIDKESLCKQNTDYLESKQLLDQQCQTFYDNGFKEKILGRLKHEQLTSTDCFSVLSRTHEFITYYDIDELVLPRVLDTQADFSQYSCKTQASICSNKTKEPNLHAYLHSIIDKHAEGRNKTKLNSISFDHAGYIIPNEIERQLVDDLGRAVAKIETIRSMKNQTIADFFPMKIPIGDPKQERRFNFVVNHTSDVEYLERFYDSYKKLIPCLYDEHLNKLPEQLFARRLYFLTHPDQRWPKAVHYYKNVKGLFIHYATDVAPGTWTLKPPASSGHFLAHFRFNMDEFYHTKYEVSIRSLFIDYEYTFYLLQHFTKYCEA